MGKLRQVHRARRGEGWRAPGRRLEGEMTRRRVERTKLGAGEGTLKMQLTAPVAEGHRTWRRQRLMGSVVPALRLVGSVVLVQPEGRLGFIASRRSSSSRCLGLWKTMWTEFLSPRERHRRGCSPSPVPGSLFIYSLHKHLFNAYYVLSQALCQNLGLQQRTSQTRSLPFRGRVVTGAYGKVLR